MADYRLSAQIISRGKGQSSVASAAYRSASRLDDPRTGEAHDYTRKRGVLFSAIVAPDTAPDWMRDRAQLWQAVEAAEKRKDAQLARELQLSLPHELTDEQRRGLLDGFVREEFVARGMVADLAIHAPGKAGDDRNHHAHVMLTMRSLTGDGFGPKVRDWNDAAQLAAWREAWARHQNRELERHGHAGRVDHRSYAAQGIDREPAQHLGPHAADMERKGKPSRIGGENRTRAATNTARAGRYADHFNIDQERRKFDAWAAAKTQQVRAAGQRQRDADAAAMRTRHAAQRAQLDARLSQRYGTHKATIRREAEVFDRRLQATGLRKILRTVTGRTRADNLAREDLARTLRGIEQREADQRRVLDRRQGRDVDELRQQTNEAERARLAGIERLRQDREAGWRQTVTLKPASPAPASPEQAFNRAAADPGRTAAANPSPQPAPAATESSPPAQERRDWWRTAADPAPDPARSIDADRNRDGGPGRDGPTRER